ncbi:chromate efflux transporter [Stigmatella erecta]|uniref:Chromate transporter n=1 Tax=Stigmatella erecta TaxID=83460 RepID=A0A1I0GVZ7_9BACT|nr:chromate efflux transporter [Stigmatella erecta]SET75551.1 chromate transporter [Stigmatella erecta]
MNDPGDTRGLAPRHPEARRLKEVALLFLRLGFTSFGGPAAHMALMEDEVVRRRRWLSRGEFLDLLGAANLIPGPNSTELAIHLGHRRAGWAGLLVAGICFILPAALIVSAAAWAYVRFGGLPSAGGLLYGVKPVIIAVVLQALWGLGRAAVKTRLLALVGLAAAAAHGLGVHELLILLSSGAFMALGSWGQRVPGQGRDGKDPAGMLAGAPWLLNGVAMGAAGAVPFSLGGLFFFFLKVGSVLFGSGYVLLAFLRADLVERWGWLTEAQLLDAVAVGQVTPGPVFTTATFIGYLLAGPLGAGVATVGIFLPAFFFVAVSGPLVPRLRRSRLAGAVLDGINVASLALMATVTWQLGRAALVDAWTVGLALLSAVLLLRFRLNSAWLVLGGSLAGILLWTY